MDAGVAITLSTNIKELTLLLLPYFNAFTV